MTTSVCFVTNLELAFERRAERRGLSPARPAASRTCGADVKVYVTFHIEVRPDGWSDLDGRFSCGHATGSQPRVPTWAPARRLAEQAARRLG